MSTDIRSTDRGMTLIELLVTITVMGAIATVLSAAIAVTFRQQGNTAASVEVARWEQTLALYLPPDLASADPTLISGAPGAVPLVSGAPCALPACTFGSNALLIGFDDGSGPTSISYRYGPATSGDGYVLTRVVCHNGSCTSRVVLRDLAPPGPSWVPGVDAPPASVISVSAPTSAPGEYASSTVVVSVNGLPTSDGVARSSTVRVTAGGLTQPPLSTPSYEGPTFIQASSGCGVPVTLIVDESGSIGAAGEVSVRNGVESFVRAFEGTPTKLQVITMNGSADVLDAVGSTAWNRFFDLSDPADVNELVGDASPGGGYLNQIDAGGQTNWEEALYRARHHSSGVTYQALGNPLIPPPGIVVFFTDGVPTRPNGADPSFGDYNVVDVDSFSPRAWYRANEIAKNLRNEANLIGVGVGDAFSTNPSQNSRNTSSLPDPWPNSIKNVVLLGDLIAGNNTPIQWDGVTEQFETVRSTDGTWGDVSTADVLGTSDMNNLGGALAAIALDSCGGTLTVQTRDGANNPADTDVTYTLDGLEQATTSRINKAVAFDVPFAGSPSATVQLVPEDLTGSGYQADGWSCRAGGANLSDWTLIGPTAGDGINVTVTTNTAVSCTMQVSPS